MNTEQKHTVLLVEDDTLIASAYQEGLAHKEITVLWAKNGKEALDMLETEIPKVILLDIIMPTLDGFGFLEQMKQNDAWKDIPVIILSNLGQDTDIAKGKELGANDFFVKSNATLHEVVEKIESYL